ncbi:uncharacterized protein CG4449 [Sipha flava]|uniref:Uncharacterized protein CG4449 n=2 Tax=Sipha flava TaxID=143950 RepID=A0A8B8G6X4_9HEMI|nr:uncharacterized protein CG4449 [Sipha flava]
MASNSENTNSNIQNTQNTAETPQMLRVLGPTIVIGDFYDGYDMSYLPPRSKRSKKEEVMFIPPDECTLEELNRTINVKVYWRETSTSTFPIRMFQSIESIFEHFVKIEQINITHITLTLHGKILRPTDTPRSINYKISDFIDGKIDFYQSSISDPSKNNEAKEEKLEDDEIKIYIMQKDVRKRIFFTIKKNEKMIILYIKVSEKLGLDIEQFTLLLDGDNIKWNDTVKTLDLEGDECVQLDEKDEK